MIAGKVDIVRVVDYNNFKMHIRVMMGRVVGLWCTGKGGRD